MFRNVMNWLIASALLLVIGSVALPDARGIAVGSPLADHDLTIGVAACNAYRPQLIPDDPACEVTATVQNCTQKFNTVTMAKICCTTGRVDAGCPAKTQFQEHTETVNSYVRLTTQACGGSRDVAICDCLADGTCIQRNDVITDCPGVRELSEPAC